MGHLTEFEYESDAFSIGCDGEVSIENLFYEADDSKNIDPAKSIELLEQVVQLCKSDLRASRWYASIPLSRDGTGNSRL